ncbi:MAG: type II toxin-antitoxin system Phd/YefM family antitoxin [Spirochaetaceae bacterium]|nr:type II toxin-antitoxin system Phd/YefM family antitoxin [Spirochaetaceae bacterium]
MARELPITEARARLTQIANDLVDSQDTVTVTNRGKPMVTLIGYEMYESIIESLEIMSDPELMAQLRQSLREARSGDVISLDQVERTLT